MRKLASVQEIISVEHHPDADRLDIVTVLGWHCITGRDEFKPGDKCVYFEIDSLLPPGNPVFEFCARYQYRIRTQRLRGIISQGLCMPASVFNMENLPIDSDVTDLIGVTKYDPPVPTCLDGVARGHFPSSIPKTDETRVQNLQDMLNRHVGLPCIITEKLDGTSVTIYLRDGVFGACSRNLDLIEDENNAIWQAVRDKNYEQVLRGIYEMSGIELALQGELIGPGIAENRYKLEKRDIYLFNIFDITNQAYFITSNVEYFCITNHYHMVPIISKEFTLTNDIDSLVSLSNGVSELNPKVKREGIVIRPHEEMYDIAVGRLSFKVVSPEYLLKHND